MMAFKQLPDPTNVPEGRENDILHATIEIGDTVLRGADIPNAEPMRSVYLTLRVIQCRRGGEDLYLAF